MIKALPFVIVFLAASASAQSLDPSPEVEAEVVVTAPAVPEPPTFAAPTFAPREDVMAERERRRRLRSIPRWLLNVGFGTSVLGADHRGDRYVGPDFGMHGTIGVGYRQSFRWFVTIQARAELFVGGLNCATVPYRTLETLPASDCVGLGFAVDATVRLGPIAWGFPIFLGIGPRVTFTHVRAVDSAGEDVRRTRPGGSLVGELGFALGAEEQGEIALRAQMGGFLNGMPQGALTLDFGWSIASRAPTL